MKCQEFHLTYVLYSQQKRTPFLQRSESNAPLKAEQLPAEKAQYCTVGPEGECEFWPQSQNFKGL